MGEAVLRNNISSSKSKTTKEKIDLTLTDELIFGICSPIGSHRNKVVESLTTTLKEKYNYEVKIIKLSEYIDEYYEEPIDKLVGRTHEYSDLMHKIKGGDNLREKYNTNSLLVELAIKQIREERKAVKTTEIKGRRVCYIIDSLKNYDELKLLRAVYRDIFYLFSIFSLEQERNDYLVNTKELSPKEAKEIIEKDDYEDIFHGQDVRNTFIEGDFFIRTSYTDKTAINERISKYLHLIFNSDIITPNKHETAMYNAKSSAGNSACLSRQVGATITDANGVHISNGWNDVPKFGGNLYNNFDDFDKRCKQLGYCSNVTHRNDIIKEIRNSLEDKLKLKFDEINQIIKIIESSKFKNVIEYSRSIHAEMHAIIIGSQLTGDKMVGGNLYCTTYPCHNCARHIVVAGIKNVYYIEPYKKSLCLTLHDDSLTEDENDDKKVKILPYDGVAPRRYLEFYSMGEDNRKDKKGNLIKTSFKDAKPKRRLSLQAIPTLENQAIHSLKDNGLLNEEDE